MAVKSMADLSDALYERNAKDFKSKAAAQRAAGTVIAYIKEALEAGDSVQLHGFGTFLVKDCAPRTAMNLQTKEPIQAPARRVVRFRSASALSKSVNP